MKSLRLIIIFLLIPFIMSLQACGEGGSTDTSGNLTLSAPTFVDQGDGSSIGNFTATYTPPSGKSPQGILIKCGVTDADGDTQSIERSLSSLSNSVVFSFQATNSTTIRIFASVNDMQSSALVFVPEGA
jgi:hypothetical protein